jgi:hypothetical protein
MRVTRRAAMVFWTLVWFVSALVFRLLAVGPRAVCALADHMLVGLMMEEGEVVVVRVGERGER